MKRFVLAAVVVSSLCLVGCHNKDDNMSNEPKKMSMDACSHCPGDQTVTADGKCSGCGAAVNK